MAPKLDCSPNGPVRVLIVDDAPIMRRAIQEILGQKRQAIEVVGTATNGRECLDKIGELSPDVVTLDIDMPVMNGITAVKNIMIRHQIPVVMISSLVEDGYFAFEALRLGVVDFIPKPTKVHGGDWQQDQDVLSLRVQIASGMHVQRMRRVRKNKVQRLPEVAAVRPSSVTVIGTTLAGPNSIMHMVSHLPKNFFGAIVALQEIHPRILRPFCQYFNEISPVEVVPLTEDTPLYSGKVYMGSTLLGARITNSQPENGLLIHVGEPASAPIDQLFSTAAEHFGKKTCGILLTGLGVDGTEGMRAIKLSGGLTLGQQQECSVYPNLVQNAVESDVVEALLSNHGIAKRVVSWTQHVK